MKPGSTIEGVIGILSRAFDSLGSAFTSPNDFAALLHNFGWTLDADRLDLAQFRNSFPGMAKLVNEISSLKELPPKLKDATMLEQADIAAKFGALLRDILKEIKGLGNPPPSLANLPSPLNSQGFLDFVTALPERAVDYFVATEMAYSYPALYRALRLLGIISVQNVAARGGPYTIPYVEKRIAWRDFGTLLSDPRSFLAKRYGWGDLVSGLIAGGLTESIESYLVNLGVSSGCHALDPAVRSKYFSAYPSPADMPRSLRIALFEDYDPQVDGYVELGLNVSPIPKPGTQVLSGLLLSPFLLGRTGKQFDLGGGLSFEFLGEFGTNPTCGVEFYPGSVAFVGDNLASLHGGAALKYTPAEPIPLLSIAGDCGAEVKRLGVNVVADASDSAQPDIKLELALDEGSLRIAPSKDDGFLAKILPDGGIQADFQLLMGYSRLHGLYFQGSGGLELQIPTHISIGPVDVQSVYLALGVGENGQAAGAASSRLSLEMSSAITAGLGPLKVTVDRLGLKALFDFPGDGGNLGPLDVDIGFKPPNGVGLSIDAGVIKGGGFLFLDPDKGEYAGALELKVAEFLTLKAIGLITTRMPDGSKGFSMLIIITAEFGSPIQLSFGFTLNAVGGLLGLHRTMLLQPLAEGVRTGAVNSVMFPVNVIQNAPRIISDLRSFFPPAQGIFLIGPMAKVGWGTPTLVTLALGIIIQIPGDVAILGVLKVALPNETNELLRLQVNFIGAIEFGKKRAWFFASMFDSRVVTLTIEGQMGVLVAWGDDANFVVSVGGFHPEFSPPPLPFPEPNRIAISILNEPAAKIRAEGYFAVTSNTAQFGARADLYFGFSAFKIDGFIAFDALFQFSPFYFIITISSKLSAKVFGAGLFTVKLHGLLEGPSPWHVEGKGSISIPCLPDIDVDFGYTWGEEADTSLPPIEVMPLLEGEYQRLENWRAELPPSSNILVTLRKIDANVDLVLHPVGTLSVSQRAVPLELTIDKVGAQKPADASYFTLLVNKDCAGLVADPEGTMEMFAMAQYQEMPDSQKLSTPAYQRLKGGVKLSASAEQLGTSGAVKRVIRYEEIIFDEGYTRSAKSFRPSSAILFDLFAKGGAAARSPLSSKYRKQKVPFTDKVAVGPDRFVVASVEDNSQVAGPFASYAAAEDYLNRKVESGSRSSRHILPCAEVESVQ